MKEKLKYKNPINLFIGILLFIFSFITIMLWWYIFMAIVTSFKLVQSYLVIEEQDNIVRKQGNKWIDKLKFVLK